MCPEEGSQTSVEIKKKGGGKRPHRRPVRGMSLKFHFARRKGEMVECKGTDDVMGDGAEKRSG